MNLTSALNFVLRAAGKPSVNDASDTDDQDANEALNTIARVRRDVLAQGWSFNTNSIDLQVDTDGRVPWDKSYLKVMWPYPWMSYRQDESNALLYVWNITDNEYYDRKLTKLPVVFDIEDYSVIPENFATWIRNESAAEFWREMNPSGAAPQYLLALAARANAMAVNSERLPTIGQITGWTTIDYSGLAYSGGQWFINVTGGG